MSDGKGRKHPRDQSRPNSLLPLPTCPQAHHSFEHLDSQGYAGDMSTNMPSRIHAAPRAYAACQCTGQVIQHVFSVENEEIHCNGGFSLRAHSVRYYLQLIDSNPLMPTYQKLFDHSSHWYTVTIFILFMYSRDNPWQIMENRPWQTGEHELPISRLSHTDVTTIQTSGGTSLITPADSYF